MEPIAWSKPRPRVNSSGEVIGYTRYRIIGGWLWTQTRTLRGKWRDDWYCPAEVA